MQPSELAIAMQMAFSILAVVVALIGVTMQNDALRYAEKGEIPDLGGGAFLGGAMGGPFETAKQFYVDLRAHYRRASSTLSMMANYVMLVSVVAGVLSGFTGAPPIAAGAGTLLIVALVMLLRFTIPRRARLKAQEQALDARRIAYNDTNFAGISEVMGLEVAQGGFQPIQPFERVRW